MFDPWIIEEIRRREAEERAGRELEQPVLERVFEINEPASESTLAKPQEQTQRGVIIVDLG